MIGHERTALHGIDHARTLAIVLPNLLEAQRKTKRGKLLQYAERVWRIGEGDEESRITAAINKTREFYESIGIPTRLKDYDVPVEVAGLIANRLRDRGSDALGEQGDLTPERIEAILKAAA